MGIITMYCHHREPDVPPFDLQLPYYIYNSNKNRKMAYVYIEIMISPLTITDLDPVHSTTHTTSALVCFLLCIPLALLSGRHSQTLNGSRLTHRLGCPYINIHVQHLSTCVLCAQNISQEGQIYIGYRQGRPLFDLVLIFIVTICPLFIKVSSELGIIIYVRDKNIIDITVTIWVVK